MRRTFRRMSDRRNPDLTAQGAVCPLTQEEKENLNVAEPGSQIETEPRLVGRS